MTTYVLRNGLLVEKTAADPDPRLHVIRDDLDYVRNHADGQVYTSKRAYERGVRAAGCEIVGNEKMPDRPAFNPGPIAPDIKAAIERLRAR